MYTKGKWVKGWGNGLTGPTTISARAVCAGGQDWRWMPVSNGKETIGIAVMQENLCPDELEANAKLMAAAPEMLEALLKLQDVIERAAAQNCVHAIEKDEVNMINAAIAKAVQP